MPAKLQVLYTSLAWLKASKTFSVNQKARIEAGSLMLMNIPANAQPEPGFALIDPIPSIFIQ
jgi:hypothetical protein